MDANSLESTLVQVVVGAIKPQAITWASTYPDHMVFLRGKALTRGTDMSNSFGAIATPLWSINVLMNVLFYSSVFVISLMGAFIWQYFPNYFINRLLQSPIIMKLMCFISFTFHDGRFCWFRMAWLVSSLLLMMLTSHDTVPYPLIVWVALPVRLKKYSWN